MNAEIVTALSLTILFVFCGITFNFTTLLIGHVVLTIPFVVLSVRPKLMQMDPNIYEAALDLGATPSKALREVIVPEIIILLVLYNAHPFFKQDLIMLGGKIKYRKGLLYIS